MNRLTLDQFDATDNKDLPSLFLAAPLMLAALEGVRMLAILEAPRSPAWTRALKELDSVITEARGK